MEIKCYFLEPINKERLFLRRYSHVRANDGHLHDSSVIWKDIDWSNDGLSSCEIELCKDDGENYPDLSNPWPTKCESCDYEFKEDDVRQRMVRTLYQRQDTGEILTLREAPIGGMYYATWLDDYEHYPKGPDGRVLNVIVPDGTKGGSHWSPDSRASNCTMKEDKVHRCWVRHGTPPNITVDKNGNTCSAGAGSIATGNWHGFLRNGYLVS